jgi:hypothetical protein
MTNINHKKTLKISILSLFLLSSLFLLNSCSSNEDFLEEIVINKNLSNVVEKNIVNDSLKDNNGYNSSLDYINKSLKSFEYNKRYSLSSKEGMVGVIDNNPINIKIKSVDKNKGINIIFNGKEYKELSSGSYIEVTKGIIISLQDIFINTRKSDDPNFEHFIFFIFEKKIIERYPNILIESSLNNFNYLSTSSIEQDKSTIYLAYYDKSRVEVEQFFNKKDASFTFSKEFTNLSKLNEYEKGKYYFLLKEAVYASWISSDKIIRIIPNSFLDFDEVSPIIEAYRKKYPSTIKNNHNCEKYYTLKEDSSIDILIDEINYSLYLYAVSTIDEKVKFK